MIVICLIFAVSSSGKSSSAQSAKEPEKPKRGPLTEAEKEAIRQADEVFDGKIKKAIQNGTYEGPLPEHIVGGHWTDLYPGTYRSYIAGVNYRKGLKDCDWYVFEATLIAEPRNKFDKNAIKIVRAEDNKKIGYVPADQTEAVRKFLDGQLPYTCKAFIESEEEDYETASGDYRTRYIYRGRFCITKDTETNTEKEEKSEETPQ